MSTISKVLIANMALSNVGNANSIESFDEQSAEARQIRIWYDYCRKAVLEAYDWNFARKRQTLALHSDDPPDEVWNYRYQYPSDCICARTIVNVQDANGDLVPFQIENSEDGTQRTILTDMEDAILVYTWDLEQTDLFSAHFVHCLSYLIAANIAMSLTGKADIKNQMTQNYLYLIKLAPAYNLNERISKPPRDAEWVRGRI